MKGHIYAIMKKPGQPPQQVAIPNRLEALQSLVGGYIETFQFAEDACILCNEDGRIIGLPYNCNVLGVDFCGDIVFIGIDDDEFSDYPIDFDVFEMLFKSLFNKDLGCVGG